MNKQVYIALSTLSLLIYPQDMYGDNNLENSMVDVVIETFFDVAAEMVKLYGVTGDEKVCLYCYLVHYNR